MKRIGLLIIWGLWLYGNIQAQSVMHVVILGDSNTFIGGDQCDKPQGWNKWFKELANPLSCRSYARSGATWTHTSNTVYDIEENTGVLSDNNVIYNQVNRLLKETGEEKTQPTPDLILIMAGTNDLWFASKRPEPLAKYIRQNCETLGTAFPKARIILITPPPFTRVPMATQHQAAAEIEQCAQAMHLSVIRLDRAKPLLPAKKLIKRGYSKDGVHTTEKGAKVLGHYIYEQVQKLLQQ